MSGPRILLQGGQHPQHAERGLGALDQAEEPHAQELDRLPVVDAEDGVEHHVEGDPLHAVEHADGRSADPAADDAPRRLAHRAGIGGEPLAGEGRQEELAHAVVRLAVEDEHR